MHHQRPWISILSIMIGTFGRSAVVAQVLISWTTSIPSTTLPTGSHIPPQHVHTIRVRPQIGHPTKDPKATGQRCKSRHDCPLTDARDRPCLPELVLAALGGANTTDRKSAFTSPQDSKSYKRTSLQYRASSPHTRFYGRSPLFG